MKTDRVHLVLINQGINTELPASRQFLPLIVAFARSGGSEPPSVSRASSPISEQRAGTLAKVPVRVHDRHRGTAEKSWSSTRELRFG